MLVRSVLRGLVGLGVLLGVLLGGAAGARCQEIWMTPHAPGPAYPGPADWQSAFTAEGPWQGAASHLKLLVASEGYLRRAPDAELTSINAFLARHGAAFGIGLQAIARIKAETCGRIEGYGSAREAETMAARFAQLKLDVRFVTADEPVWFGHASPDPRACRYPVADVAHRVAQTLRGFLQYYPDAMINEVEPIPALTSTPHWQQDLAEFRSVLEADLGHRLVSLNVDMAWAVPVWPQHLREIAAYAHSAGLRFGILYNGDTLDRTPEAWAEHARRHFERIEGELGIIPDQAVFASWNRFPERIGPDTDPSSYAGLIMSYQRPRTRFVLAAGGSGIAGRLVDAAGHGVPHAAIELQAVGLGGSAMPELQRATGTVPPLAREARLAVGVNIWREPGDNDVVIGDFAYSENGGAARTIGWPDAAGPQGMQMAPAMSPSGQRLTRLVVPRDRKFRYAFPQFPVDPGARFTLQVPAGSATGQPMFGTVDLVWVDAAGHDLKHEQVLRIEPSALRIASVVSGNDGGFATAAPPPGNPAQRLVFAGTPALRGATLDLPGR